MNGIHPIERNYSLYNMKKKQFYPNLNFRIYHDFKHFFTVFELLNISTLTNNISIDVDRVGEGVQRVSTL